MATDALRFALRRRNAIPGLGLSLGITLTFVVAIVVVPLAFVVLTARGLPFAQIATVALSHRALHSYLLTFGTAAIAAAVSSAVGLLIAVMLVRYRFTGRSVLDAVVDVPFALPPAVAGIALTALYAPVHVAFTATGITIALIFVGLPFTVRTVGAALAELPAEYEEVANTLGCGSFAALVRIVVPLALPSLLAGFALALARGIGEYGSIVFIAGNIPNKTEVTSLLVMTHLEEFDYAGAAVLAIVMLCVSVSLLFAVNLLYGALRRKRSQA